MTLQSMLQLITAQRTTHMIKEIAYLQVPEQLKLNIAAKLHQGISIDRVMDDVRANVYGDCSREHIITKQDIRNVLREFNILGIERHSNDYQSVEVWITEMRLQDHNPVLYFKQQGKEDVENVLKKEDFLLCIQTEFQLEMLKG